MLVLLCDLDALIPSVQLLVHGHGFFDLVVLDQDCLSLVELLVEDGHLGLDTEVLGALSGDQLVQLAEIVSLSDITESCIASLCHV